MISELDGVQVQRLIDDGTIRGGMIPKIQACLRALETVPRVHVLDGRQPHALLRELFTDEGSGSMLVGPTDDPYRRDIAIMTTATARSSADWIELERNVYFAGRRAPVVLERGQGCRVWDVDGRSTWT